MIRRTNHHRNRIDNKNANNHYSMLNSHKIGIHHYSMLIQILTCFCKSPKDYVDVTLCTPLITAVGYSKIVRSGILLGDLN